MRDCISTTRLLCVACAMFVPLFTSGQQAKVDSLMQLLPGSRAAKQVDIYCELAKLMGETDHHALDMYARKAQQIATELCDTFRIVQTSRLRGQAYRRMSRFDSAIFTFKSVIPLAVRKGYSQELSKVWNGLGVTYIMLGNYDEAYDYLIRFLERCENDGDRSSMAAALTNLGLIFYKMSDFQTAISYYNSALEIELEQRDKFSAASLLSSISLCYAYMGNTKDARRTLQDANRMCGQVCTDEFKKHGAFGLGVCFFIEGDLKTARKYFYEGYLLAESMQDERMQLDNLIYLAKTSIAEDHLDAAIPFLAKAEKLVGDRHVYKYELLKVHAEFSALHLKLQNFEYAAAYQQKARVLQDSIYNGMVTANLMRAQAQYIENSHKLRASAQQQILLLKEDVIRWQGHINFFIIIVALLLISLLFVALKSNRRKQRLNQLLDQVVRQRTHELQNKGDDLQRASNEIDAVLTMLAVSVKSSIATIKGLCFLAKKDKDATTKYLDEVLNVAEYVTRTMDHAINLKVDNVGDREVNENDN